MTRAKYRYRLGGVELRSFLPLPEAEPGGTGKDVSIEAGKIPPLQDEAGQAYRSRIGKEQACFYFQGVGRFQVSREKIVVDRFPGVSDRVLRSWIYGIPLAVLFHYRGCLVLHGSVVEIDERALVFLGDPGDGKSTTAAALIAAGAKFVSDDHAYLEVSGGEVFVRRGIKHGRLRLSAAELFMRQVGSSVGLDVDEEKLGYLVAPHKVSKQDLIPVSSIYVLSEKPSISVVPLVGSEAVMALVRYSMMVNVLDKLDTRPWHFLACAEVARRVPVRRLGRPKQLSVLRQIIDAVFEAETLSFRDVRSR